MPCRPFQSEDGRIRGILCTTPEYEYTHEGRTWRFEYSAWGGPWPLRRDGQPFKNAPGLKSKFWPAFAAWWKEKFDDPESVGQHTTEI